MKKTLESEIITELKRRKYMLCCIESCTGGLIASKITNIPGSSEVFWGGLITYHNTAKETLCSIPRNFLNKHHPVSKEIAKAMALGGLKQMKEALATSRSDNQKLITVSTTGIAGPGGGTTKKPIGLCYVGIAKNNYPAKTFILRESANKTRRILKSLFSEQALQLLLNTLKEEPTDLS